MKIYDIGFYSKENWTSYLPMINIIFFQSLKVMNWSCNYLTLDPGYELPNVNHIIKIECSWEKECSSYLFISQGIQNKFRINIYEICKTYLKCKPFLLQDKMWKKIYRKVKSCCIIYSNWYYKKDWHHSLDEIQVVPTMWIS